MNDQPHPTACHCARCAAIAAGATPAEADAQIRARDAEMLDRFGWLAHIVTDDQDSPTGFNWHTHGLQERYNHRDFQIVCPLPPKVAHQIGTTLADRVKAGETFGSGQKLDDVLQGDMLVKLVAATECGRQVLRIIVPDRAGKLDLGEIAEPFARQYADLDEEVGGAADGIAVKVLAAVIGTAAVGSRRIAVIENERLPTEQRPRPCWNIFSVLTPFLAIVCAIAVYCVGQFVFQEHPAHLKTAATTLGAILALGFAFACIAAVRHERLWGLTGLGMVLNAPFVLIAWAVPWDWPF